MSEPPLSPILNSHRRRRRFPNQLARLETQLGIIPSTESSMRLDKLDEYETEKRQITERFMFNKPAVNDSSEADKTGIVGNDSSTFSGIGVLPDDSSFGIEVGVTDDLRNDSSTSLKTGNDSVRQTHVLASDSATQRDDSATVDTGLPISDDSVVVDTRGFRTASGKRLQVSGKALDEAAKLFGDDDLTLDGGGKLPIPRCETDDFLLPPRVRGFSTAAGKTIVLPDGFVSEAAKFFSETFDDLPDYVAKTPEKVKTAEAEPKDDVSGSRRRKKRLGMSRCKPIDDLRKSDGCRETQVVKRPKIEG